MATILDGAVTVAITAVGATPQSPNITIPAFACYLPSVVATVFGSNLTRSYIAPSGWTDDGGAVTDAAYLWLTEVFAQNPAPASAKIIRLTTAVTQTCSFLVTDTTVGNKVGYQVVGTDGVVVDCYVTCSGTVGTDATAIAALADPTGVSMTASVATVTILNAATKTQVFFRNVKGGTFTDNTPSASVSTDLDAALLQDNNWYMLSIAYMDATNIAAAAAWAETNKRLFAYTTVDTANLTGGTGIGSTNKTATRTYSLGLYSASSSDTFPGSGLGVQLLVADPGALTLAYKTIANTTADTLNVNQITALETNNLSYYLANIAGVNTTFKGSGKCASGMWADIRYGIDALHGVQQTNIFTLLSTAPKVPMDPKGIAMVGGEVRKSLQQFTATDAAPAALLRSDPGYEWWVTLPAVSAITASDRSARILRNVKWGAYAQNAIQTVLVAGNVSV